MARIWRGAVRAEDADEYVRYIEETGLREYRETPGNRGAWLLRRLERDRYETSGTDRGALTDLDLFELLVGLLLDLLLDRRHSWAGSRRFRHPLPR